MQLNLPPFDANIKSTKNGDQIFDILRQRYVALTPEEHVRQHFIHYLINSKNFPAGLMANEYHLTLNGTSRRCDTVVFDHSAKPLVIVEYKAPSVTITQKTFDQIARYNMVLNAHYLIVSNGMTNFCCCMDCTNNSYTFLKEIPLYDELI